jgi:hypothetical protein
VARITGVGHRHLASCGEFEMMVNPKEEMSLKVTMKWIKLGLKARPDDFLQ